MLNEFILGLWGTCLISKEHLSQNSTNLFQVYAQRGQDIIDQSIPWTQIAATPQTYIVSSFWPSTMLVKSPASMTLPELYMIAELVRVHQKDKPTTPYITFKVNNPDDDAVRVPQPARKKRVITDSDDDEPTRNASPNHRAAPPDDDDDDDDAWIDDDADQDPRVVDPGKGISLVEELAHSTPGELCIVTSL